MKIHHTTEMKDHCTVCNRPFIMNWYDKEEKNGHSETKWRNDICTQCIEKKDGRPPLGLVDLNEIAERGITKDEYYKEQGYPPHISIYCNCKNTGYNSVGVCVECKKERKNWDENSINR